MKPESASIPPRVVQRPWVVVIVDDEPDVHEVSRLVLDDLSFDGRPVEILSAYSAAEGRRIFEQRGDIAVALIDVVMEHERAGLDLVAHVRQRLDHRLTRLILRTGQPGMAPEREIVAHFDIDDYKEKTELTADRLYATIYAALRSYQALWSLEQTRRGLSRIADMASHLMRCQGMAAFAAEALRQMGGMSAALAQAAGAAAGGAASALPKEVGGLAVASGVCASKTDPLQAARVLAGTGRWADGAGQSLDEALGPASAQKLRRIAREGGLASDDDSVILGVDAGEGWCFGLWIQRVDASSPPVDALWEVFAAKVIDAARALRAMESRAEVAEAASRAKSQFLANISHEIRTPLNAVLGMLTLLQSTPLSVRQNDYVTKTQGAARSLLQLLNDVLDFSKAEAHKMRLDPRPFRIERMLRDLSVILSASVGDKPIEIRFDVGPDVPPVLVGDDLRLQQVLMNLGSNAIKFTEAGEVVIRLRRVEFAAPEACIEFSVRDTGIGIAKDQQTDIFSGFSQAEASTTRRFGGTGLGLAICAHLVGLMGGEIELDSEPGRGSDFHFRIHLLVVDASAVPADPVGGLSAAALAPPAPVGRLNGLRVLVVEDNPNNQQVAQELLETEGARVTLAGDGRKGVDAVRLAAPPFDAVLLDLQMPVMDGFAAARELRADPVFRHLPIIAMTANTTAADREACLAVGMTDHIGKPFELPDLVRCLRRHTGDAVATDGPLESPALLEGTALGAEAQSLARQGGVEIVAALGRFGGHTGVYERMLRRFLSDAPVLLSRLDMALQADSLAQAAAGFHTLRGLSGTLGLNAMSSDCAEAEQALRDSLPPRDAAARVAGLRAHVERLTEVGEALAAALRASAQALASAHPMTPDEIRHALQSLEGLLRRHDMGALELLEQSRRPLSLALGASFAELDQAVQALDFDRAAQICRESDNSAATPGV